MSGSESRRARATQLGAAPRGFLPALLTQGLAPARRRFAPAVLGLALAAATPTPAPAQEGVAEVAIRTQRVAEGVYMLEGQGGNIGALIGEDGIVLVDDQFAPLTELIRQALAELSQAPLRFVLNTHWHGDHTGGNENLGRAGALIVAHDRVRERMSVEQVNRITGRRTAASPQGALPVVTFSESVTLHLSGLRIQVEHVRSAHTDGDSLVFIRGVNVIHMGDIFFNRRYPFIDLASGGSVDGMLAAIDRGLAESDQSTKLIPGHGPLATRADLVVYRDMLRELSGRVRALVKQGKSLEEVKAARPTAGYDAVWAWRFISGERFAAMLYLDATR